MDAYGEIPTVVEEFEVEEHEPNVPMATLKSMCKIARIPTDGPLDGLYKLSGDTSELYYKCMDPRIEELTNEKLLYIIHRQEKSWSS